MSLLSRRQTVTEVPPELQPYYDGNTTRTLWVRRLVAFVVLVLIIILIVFFVRWVWHATHHTKVASKSDITQSQTDKAEAKKSSDAKAKAKADSLNNEATLDDQAAKSDSTPSTSTSSTSSAAAGKSATSSTSTTTSNAAELANTGPGTTLAIFATASAAGAILYQYLLRRSATNE